MTLKYIESRRNSTSYQRFSLIFALMFYCFLMFASVLPGILRVLFHPFVLKPLGSEFYEWGKGLLHEL